MAHPLDGAGMRLARADAHLTEADKLLREWEQGCVDKIVRQDDGQYRFNGFPDIPSMLPVIVGDVMHNLRAALDYLVYELSLLDSKGQIKDGTQFPIEDVKSNPTNPSRCFDGRRKSYLKGLSDTHVDAIEALQPYNGVEWTETLRDVSNPDKHRHLTVITKGNRVQAALKWHPDGRLYVTRFNPGGPPKVERFDVEVDGQYTIAITLPKRGETALFPTLRRLQAEVGQTIVLFEPEFK